ncbi:NAD-dependent epimerase/dehydratase family protein [Saccharibacillus sp. CPCC 101409]|uniref:NAD-dependent epimerase/dehydratase family protein n=1 Tax=Saccharibacillus sp. CPCC 101409 TaxID=3058041 RepID=UPI002672A0A7|nr:NAD-dependent epimerase/dehydratase family protein [Saccharibacillus sp. CPCC 101409]MDO3411583.1 NAD-dependent epimerase/dehydratase family protein [Saccharibacillus sp. CPCC 101409]
MKVLVTGGYGFIGSFVAERFYKEGYDVYIIDNLSSGNKQNIDFEHKSYILSVEDPKCEAIFRANRFDAVVHLAAQVNVSTSIRDPVQDAQSNVLGLTNILTLASRYEAGKLIFASSAAVYGTTEQLPIPETSTLEPISPYGINKMIGETYCAKWTEIYGLDTLCFRFSNVYGPRQGNSGEGGVVSIFIKQLLSKSDLNVNGDGNQTRDFIYVEDVADAIYRASYSSMSGTYNLSTRTESSINDLIRELHKLYGETPVHYEPPREGDIYRSVLDNRRVMQALDWAPKYHLQTGLQRMFERTRQERSAAPSQPRPEAKVSLLGNPIKKALPYIENLLAFAAFCGIGSLLSDNVSAGLDLMMVYIILMGIFYGSRQSMLAVALAIGFYIREQTISGHDMVSQLYDSSLFFQLALYLLTGLAVGYSIDRRRNRLNDANQQLAQASEKYAFLHKVHEDTRSVKDELQKQILSTEHSFGKMQAVTRSLDNLEPERIILAAVGVLEDIMKTDEVTIYTVNRNKNYLRLAGCSSKLASATARSLKVDEHEYLIPVVYDQQMYINKTLLPDAPLLSAPVISHGEIVAIVSLHAVEFNRFTLYYQNLFKTTVELISSSLSRAHTYIDAAAGQRYVDADERRVLRTEAFMDILSSKQEASEQLGTDFALLHLEMWDVSPREIERLHSSLRETDYLGLGPNGELMLLLSNSSQSEGERIMDRLRKQLASLPQKGAEHYA